MDEQEFYDWCIRQIKKLKVKQKIAQDDESETGDSSLINYYAGQIVAFGVMARKIKPCYRGGELPALLRIQ